MSKNNKGTGALNSFELESSSGASKSKQQQQETAPFLSTPGAGTIRGMRVVKLPGAATTAASRRRRRRLVIFTVFGLVAVLLGWVMMRGNTATTGGAGDTDTAHTIESFGLKSPAFSSGQAIPRVHARIDGNNESPPLKWHGVPDGTKSLVLILDDPDAPDPDAPAENPWVHWVLYNIPPDTTELPTAFNKQIDSGNSKAGKDSKAAAAKYVVKQAQNDWKKNQYDGPQPPGKNAHRYFFKLYALNVILDDLGTDATKATVESAMESHILAKAMLVGTYQKK